MKPAVARKYHPPPKRHATVNVLARILLGVGYVIVGLALAYWIL